MTTPNQLTPQQRLANSRQALVSYMASSGADTATSPASGPVPDSAFAGGRGHLWKIFRRAVQAWWRYHPVHTALDIVAGTARPVLTRYAHDKPVQLLGAAAALGAALVVVQPWRLVSITGLLLATLKSSGLTTTLLSLLSAQSELNDSPESPSKTS
jgi:cobalamin biosynthesis protein CobD/CbiB